MSLDRRSVVPTLAIVVPCYDEEQALPFTCERLRGLLGSLIGEGVVSDQSRICFVDDGSRDRTWTLVREFAARDPHVGGIRLSRNRGHQNALLAGMMETEGDMVVSIDADLQDDVAAIPEMISRFAAGYDVVYGVRRRRDADTPFKRLTARSYYVLLGIMGVTTVPDHADFRLVSRRVVEALRGCQEVNLYIRGLIPLLGFRSTTVTYDRVKRVAGETKYPFRRMLALALDGITSFSVVPLRLIAGVGLLTFAGALLATGWALWVRLFTDRAVPGWASSVLPVYFLGGIQLLSLGIIGEYLAKIYLEAKRRPRYIVQDAISATGSASADSPTVRGIE